MMSIPTAFLTTTSLLIMAASPQSPVALIEDIAGNPPDLQFMDYVQPGQVIHLGAQDTIVLGYLKSCWRETITGGTVTVGQERSDVQDGTVERSTVPCDGGKMLLTAELASKSGASVFRNLRQLGRLPKPELTIYGLSPVVEVNAGGMLVIERVDKPGEQYRLDLRSDRLMHGAFLDLTKADVILSAGGIYRAQAGSQEIVFKIDRNAQPGETPIIGRLLRLQPPS
jgi:hypothetical protein